VALSATYAYDPSGQRTHSVVTDTATGSVTSTDFTYQGLLLERLSATRTQGETTETWQMTYLYDEYGRPYGGLYQDRSDPEDPGPPVFFGMVTTDRGDVVELLDANGSPFAAYRYDPWGNPLGAGNVPGTAGVWAQQTLDSQQQVVMSAALAAQIATRQVLRYASYCFDSESGMYYLSSRHYDPATRQFLSKDLSRNDGEQSAYGYCLGNPVGNIDPTGYTPELNELRYEKNYMLAKQKKNLMAMYRAIVALVRIQNAARAAAQQKKAAVGTLQAYINQGNKVSPGLYNAGAMNTKKAGGVTALPFDPVAYTAVVQGTPAAEQLKLDMTPGTGYYGAAYDATYSPSVYGSLIAVGQNGVAYEPLENALSYGQKYGDLPAHGPGAEVSYVAVRDSVGGGAHVEERVMLSAKVDRLWDVAKAAVATAIPMAVSMIPGVGTTGLSVAMFPGSYAMTEDFMQQANEPYQGRLLPVGGQYAIPSAGW
jgi:RHS repeat-associated protein